MKRITKKILCLLLSLAIIISTVLAVSVNTAFGATSGQAGAKITWSYNATNTTLTLNGIGETYDFRATSIATNKKCPWEDYKKEITKLVVGEGITYLGQYAMYNCVALTDVSLPSTLEGIGGLGTMTTSYGCFQNCTSLQTIVFPDSLTKIGNCAFKDCTALTSVTFPNGFNSLGYGAFTGCTKLVSVTFGDSLIETGNNAFYDCTGLKNVIWGGINKVSTYAFYGFFGSSVEFPETVSYIGFRSFAQNYNLRSITIHNPDCEIVTSNLTEEISPFAGHQQDVTIYGHTGSTAQDLANKYNYTFISLDPCNHEETYENVAVEPTCLEKGTLQLVCSSCGQIVKTSDIDPLGHDYQVVEKVDNTTVDGHIYSTERCSRCDDTKDVIEHARTGLASPRYVWVEGYYEYSNSATCTTPGVERYKCTIEGCTMTNNLNNNIQTQETISASLGNHTVDEWTVTQAPTCTEDGTRTGVCTVCGATTTETLKATGHIYSTEEGSADLVIIVTSEESQDGHDYKIYQCQNCEEQPIIPVHVEWLEGGYDSTVITEPRCVIDGLRHDTCTTCGETRNVVLPANGQHEWYETSRTEASCTVAGQIYYACRNCTLTKTERSEALGHDYVKVDASSKAPTCTENGYDFERCSRCSATRQVTVEKLGHTPNQADYTVTASPTCEETGTAVSSCTVCGAEFEIVIDALGHDYVDQIQDLTAENKPGHSLVTPVCTRCNTRQASTMRHDEWLQGYFTSADTTNSTCNVQGYSTDTCTICNTTRRNYKPALGHIYNYVGDNSATSENLASMTYEGMLYRCAICQRTYRALVADVIRHWDNSVVNSREINRSGDPNGTYEISDWSSLLDANGDNIINAKDYAILKRCNKKQQQLIEEERAKIYIMLSCDTHSFNFELADNPVANEFLNNIPMSITMTDNGSNSKIYKLEGSIEGNDESFETVRLAVAGDVLLTRNNELIIYYKGATVNGEYVRLGRIGDTEYLTEAFGTGDVTLDFEIMERII